MRLGRLDRDEIAGGLGDSGLFVPIAVALITINGLQATAVFAVTGLAYLGTALYFRVPVPVQPLKAFAATAIALGLSAATLAAGALLMSICMAAMAASGAADWLASRFPLVLTRGIQASVALLLTKGAIELARKGNWAGLPHIEPTVGLATAVGCCALLFVARTRLPVPGALLVLGGGLAAGVAISGLPSGLALGPQSPRIALPGGGDFATALGTLVIAQLPLTFGNAVVATSDAEREYFGDRAARVTPARLAGSISVWNGLAGLAGGLPVCHGAGGVTAHYRLGARSAAATAFTGALFLGLAVVAGSALPKLLTLLLPGALAGMLLFVAIQHALLASRLEHVDDRLIAASVGAVTVISGNLAIGFALGVAAVALRWAARVLLENGRASTA
jgi:sulfate permease, SulP family